MKLAALLDSEKWTRHLAIRRKRLIQPFRKRCDSRPLFLLGKQRSGTSMMMQAFHRHPELLVYDEHRNSVAFKDHRLRSFETVRELLGQARFPIVCFKSISDSHLIKKLYDSFPSGYYVWVYRDYRDVANSSLRKFAAPTRAIRLVCTDQPGGGWFQEGVSPAVADVLRSVYQASTLSDFDLACLVWWARNQTIMESELIGRQNVILLRYESVVTEPPLFLEWLFNRIGTRYHERLSRNITPRSIRRHPVPAINSRVKDLCDASLSALDEVFCSGAPQSKSYDRHRQKAG